MDLKSITTIVVALIALVVILSVILGTLTGRLKKIKDLLGQSEVLLLNANQKNQSLTIQVTETSNLNNRYYEEKKRDKDIQREIATELKAEKEITETLKQRVEEDNEKMNVLEKQLEVANIYIEDYKKIIKDLETTKELPVDLPASVTKTKRRSAKK